MWEKFRKFFAVYSGSQITSVFFTFAFEIFIVPNLHYSTGSEFLICKSLIAKSYIIVIVKFESLGVGNYLVLSSLPISW